MSTAVSARPARPAAPGRVADRIGRGLLVLCALAALATFAAGFATIAAAPDDRLVVEAWRTFGFGIFAAMWVMLALRPRRSPGIWELVLLHKIALSVFALTVLPAPGAGEALVADASLVVVTVIAYVLCRGWLSWGVWRDAPS